MRTRIFAATLILSMGAGPAGGQSPARADLSALSLEQLTSLDVNTVSRREQKLFETPAAVYVITREQIVRSHATSIPEMLRMVPGLEVAQIDANTWAVSARGFNSRFANKMLIMIDNRSIYNPVYSGTLWDHEVLLPEDIERIEVVRGPGATMWGANAVNGVINIVTRRARETAGTLAVAHASSLEQDGWGRQGWSMGPRLSYRLYSGYWHHNALLAEDGSSASDSGSSERAGGRMDWKPSADNSFQFEGELMRAPEHHRINFGYGASSALAEPVYDAGGFLMGRWERSGANSDAALEGYYSNGRRDEIGMKLDVRIADLDFQHHFFAGSRHEIVWGMGYRWTSDTIGGEQMYFAHRDHIVNLSSAFFQDSLTLLPATLILTGGTKLQWNTYTHFEVQPSVRLLWTPSRAQSVWASVSRAVRTPSDQDHDVRFLYPLGELGGVPLYGLIQGNPRLASELVVAWEAGYRHQFGSSWSLDVASFVNHYSDLESTLVGNPYPVFEPSLSFVQPFVYFNGFSADTQGVETALAWSPARAVQLQGSYAWMQGRLISHGAATVQPSGGQDWSTPRNTVDVRANWSLTSRWSMGAVLDANSTVPSSLPYAMATIPGHTRMDLSLTRRIGESGSIDAGVANLLEPRHAEFFPEDYTMHSRIPRSAYIGVRWNR